MMVDRCVANRIDLLFLWHMEEYDVNTIKTNSKLRGERYET